MKQHLYIYLYLGCNVFGSDVGATFPVSFAVSLSLCISLCFFPSLFLSHNIEALTRADKVYTHAHAHARTCTHAHIYRSTYTSRQGLHTYTNTCTHTHTCTHTYIHTNVHNICTGSVIFYDYSFIFFFLFSIFKQGLFSLCFVT